MRIVVYLICRSGFNPFIIPTSKSYKIISFATQTTLPMSKLLSILFLTLVVSEGYGQTVINAIPETPYLQIASVEAHLMEAGLEIHQLFKEVRFVTCKGIDKTTKKTGRQVRFVSFYLKDHVEIEETIALLKNTALFTSVEEDHWGELAATEVNDPGMSQQWYLDNKGTRNGAKAGADIRMKDAWDFAKGSDDIIVGFIDSGVKTDHADLEGRVWVNTAEVPNDGRDNDNNGFIDDEFGWNTYSNDADVEDRIAHGTQINGIVGAVPNNSLGFAGMDWNCKLMNIRGVDNAGKGLLGWWSQGIYYLVDNGADIINMSLQSTSGSDVLKQAVDYAYEKGVLVVSATGNFNRSTISYPAKYDNVLAVGATDHADERAQWSGVGSNYGEGIDVVAPGKAIYGLIHTNDYTTAYVTAGTSQATPQVSALASLLLSMNPALSPDSITSIITHNADDMVGPELHDKAGWDPQYGHGRINAYKTLKSMSMAMGTQEVASEISTHFKVWPTQVESTLNVQVDVESGQLYCFSANGRLLKRIDLEPGIHQVSIQEFPPNVYLLHWVTNKGSFPQRVVKY